jgi:hypothetical protein
LPLRPFVCTGLSQLCRILHSKVLRKYHRHTGHTHSNAPSKTKRRCITLKQWIENENTHLDKISLLPSTDEAMNEKARNAGAKPDMLRMHSTTGVITTGSENPMK